MRISKGVGFFERWWQDEYGIITKSKMLESMDEQIETNVKRIKILYDRYGHLGLGEPDPDPWYEVPTYDALITVASSFTDTPPEWDDMTASFCYDSRYSVWGGITDAGGIERIKVPDWDDNPLVNEMLERYERERNSSFIKEGKVTYPYTAMKFFNPITGVAHESVFYLSPLDMAPFLYGDTDFFAVMMDDDEFTFAVYDKCYEIATSYTDYMVKAFGIDAGKMGWMNIGGDYACLMSPALYRKYVKPYDERRAKGNNDFSINLHSCGASAHLYDVWREYPNRGSISQMQTRGIPGKLAHLRECLPDTLICLALHQPQCDFENIPAAEVERTVRGYAEEAGYGNLQLDAYVVKSGENTDKNIAAFCNTIDAINEGR